MPPTHLTLTLWFSAPFRTPLSVDTPTLIADQARGKATLEQAAGQFARDTGAQAISPWADNTSLKQSRYRTLRDDSDQQFVSPLLQLTGHESLAGCIQAAALAAVEQAAGKDALEIRVPPGLVRLSLFDNTMGVLEWALELKGAEPALASVFPEMDRTSYEITDAGVRHAQARLLPVAMRALDQAFGDAGRNDRRMARALLRPSRFRVFVDVAGTLERSTKLTTWPDATDDTGLMWVSRVLVGRPVGPELAAAIAAWTPASLGPAARNGAELRAEVGNSVLADAQEPVDLGDMADSFRKAQYIYSLLDVHARNITRLYAQFLARREKVASHTLASLDAIQSHVDYIDMQLIDVYDGLQSSRHEMVSRLRKKWDLDAKMRELVRKCDAARRRVESLVHTRSARYQKMVQFILGGVGVMALADLLINLAAFSHSPEARAWDGWGLLRLVQGAAPDSFVTTSVLGSCILLLLVAMLIRKG